MTVHAKKDLDGYLLIDNRASGGGMQECSTLTCSHCNRVVVLNPQRTRARGYCRKCDHYVCDLCEGQPCLTLNQLFDELREVGARGVDVTEDTIRALRRDILDA